MQNNNYEIYDKMSQNELEILYINSDDKTIKNYIKSILCQLALAEEWEPSEFEIYIEHLDKKKKNNYSVSNIVEHNIVEHNITEEDIDKMSLFQLENLYLNISDKKILSMIISGISQYALQREWDSGELSYYLTELDKQKRIRKKKN